MTLFAFASNATPACAGKFTVFQTNLPPFNFISDNKTREGISVDTLVEIMKNSGYELKPEQFSRIPLARALRYTEKIENSILFSIARTEQRENKFKWVGPVYNLNLGLICRKDKHISIAHENDLRKYKIAVIRDSAPQSILTQRYGLSAKNLNLVASDTQQFKMLDHGRVDMITQSDTGAPSLIRKAGLNPEDFEICFVMMKLPLYYVLNKRCSDDFVNNLQKNLDRLKQQESDGSSRLEKIISKYVGGETITIRDVASKDYPHTGQSKLIHPGSN